MLYIFRLLLQYRDLCGYVFTDSLNGKQCIECYYLFHLISK